MMSLSKLKTELLTHAYVRKNTKSAIAMPLLKPIQLFHDKYFYFRIKNSKIKKFVTAKNGDLFYSKTFVIKGVQFECLLYPNGYSIENEGYVDIYIYYC